MEYLYLVSLVPAFMFYVLKCTKSLHMLQQNWYNEGNRYLSWIVNNLYKVFIDIDMFFIVFIVGMFTNAEYLAILFAVFYIVCIALFVNRKKTEQVKKPLNYTKRVKRLIITEIVLFILAAPALKLSSRAIFIGLSHPVAAAAFFARS